MKNNKIDACSLIHIWRLLNLNRLKSVLVIKDSTIIIKLMNNVKNPYNRKLNHIIERTKNESLHIEDIKFFHFF